MENHRIIRSNAFDSKTPNLQHYGVLGMKWGVRRTPEQLGRHIIKKGTTMYRTTVDTNESTKGSTYVTYLPPDRDLYRFYGGHRRGKQLYEKRYKLSKDLVVPSRNELTEAIYEVVKKDVDNKFLREVAQTRVDWLSKDPNYINIVWNAEDEQVRSDIRKLSGGEASQIYESAKYLTRKRLTDNVENFIQEIANESPYEIMGDITPFFGGATKTRQAVIDELKKRGYNAMVDEASVGGKRDLYREGVDPIIVFDQEETMNQIRVKPVTKSMQNQAQRNYMKWNTVANLYSKNKQW